MDLEKRAENKRLIIWDLDGVIAKLDIDWPLCRIETKKYLEDTYNLIFPEETRVDKMEATVLQKFGQEALKQIVPMRERYEQGGIPNSKLNLPVIEYIKTGYNQGKIMTICSNNLRRTVNRFLEHFNLKEYFSFFIGMDDTYKPKPNTEGCQMILDRFAEINKKDILYIGDNYDSDQKTAEALGIDYLEIKMPS